MNPKKSNRMNLMLQRYGYIIIMITYRCGGKWEHDFRCFKTKEGAAAALGAGSCFGEVWELVSMTEAKANGFEPEPAAFYDEAFLKEGTA